LAHCNCITRLLYEAVIDVTRRPVA